MGSEREREREKERENHIERHERSQGEQKSLIPFCNFRNS